MFYYHVLHRPASALLPSFNPLLIGILLYFVCIVYFTFYPNHLAGLRSIDPWSANRSTCALSRQDMSHPFCSVWSCSGLPSPIRTVRLNRFALPTARRSSLWVRVASPAGTSHCSACSAMAQTFSQERLSDLIGPYWGTCGIVYRVTQPVLECSLR